MQTGRHQESNPASSGHQSCRVHCGQLGHRDSHKFNYFPENQLTKYSVRVSTAIWRWSDLSFVCTTRNIYRVSQKKVAPWGFLTFFLNGWEFIRPNFTCLLCVPIYDRLPIFIQLSPTLMKLCHIKRDHPVHIVSAKCPPSVKTHAGIFWRFPQSVGNF